MSQRTELGVALRAWRDRVRPEEVGLLGGGGRRRSPGLRREELADLAGLSVDYLIRLEQGRAINPSPQVLASLSRALRLSGIERDLLYAYAGVAAPSARVVSRHISPGLQRVLDRLADTPVGVYTASWELLVTNRLWQALFGEHDRLSGREANLIWRFFTDEQSTVSRTAAEYEQFAEVMVSDLRDVAARYVEDRELAAMIADLRTRSDWFARLWASYIVGRQMSDRKTILSPTIGPVTVDCDILTAADTDLRIVVYTARPGSEDAGKLDLLRVAGLQTI